MSSPRALAGVLLGIAIATGTLSDRPLRRPPLVVGGYHVLAADFHVHSSVLSGATLAPWDLVLEARRQGLDVFAITPHNQLFPARIGRWFSEAAGGPRVIVAEEVRGPRYHLIALGIDAAVSWRLTAAAAIDEIHRQGGIAIAAHPVRLYWPAYDAGAMGKLDGTEVMHPGAYLRERAAVEMRQFYEEAGQAAIGSSDYHGLGRMGMCRTYVFATDDSERAILDAIRAHRTVVYDRGGRAYGDAALIRLAAQDGHVRDGEPGNESGGMLATISRVAGILGLLVAVFRR